MFNLDTAAFLSLLKVFVPFGSSHWILDICLFVVLPAIIICVSIQIAKAMYRKSKKTYGAWRTAGYYWFYLMWINIVAIALIFSLIVAIIGDHTSYNSGYEKQYRAQFVQSGKLSADNKAPLKDLISYAIEHAANKSRPDARRLIQFFHDAYAILHYLPWAICDISFIMWFFGPGISMRKEKTKF